MPAPAASSTQPIDRVTASASARGVRFSAHRAAMLDAEFGRLMGDITAQLALEQAAEGSSEVLKSKGNEPTSESATNTSVKSEVEVTHVPAEVVPVAKERIAQNHESTNEAHGDTPDSVASESHVEEGHTQSEEDPKSQTQATNNETIVAHVAQTETDIPTPLVTDSTAAKTVDAETELPVAPTDVLPEEILTTSGTPTPVTPAVGEDSTIAQNTGKIDIDPAKIATTTTTNNASIQKQAQVSEQSGDDLALLMQSVLQGKLTPATENTAIQPIAQPTVLSAPKAEISDLLLAQLSSGLLGAGIMNGSANAERVQETAARISNVKSVSQSQPTFANVNENRLSSTTRSVADDAKQPRAQLSKAVAARTLERVESALKEVAQSRDGKTISLRLDPPQLGSVKIDVSLRDGALHARVVAETPAVNALLRDRSSELQAALRKLGLNVDRITVATQGDMGHQATFNNELANQEQHKGSSNQGTFFSNIGPQVVTVVNAVKLDHWVA